MKIDTEKANVAIDDYLAAISNPNAMPYREASTYAAKFRLERFGVIPDARALDLLDHCVLWCAVVTICRRINEVSRTEMAERAVHKGHSLAKTIRALKNPKSTSGRTEAGRRFRQHLADNGILEDRGLRRISRTCKA